MEKIIHEKNLSLGYSQSFFLEQSRLILGHDSEDLACALRSFRHGQYYHSFSEHLKNFIKPVNALADLSSYSLRGDMRVIGTGCGKYFPTKYFDSRYNFCMTSEASLVASVGFDAEKDAIRITQLQGIRGKGEFLSPFRWESALVSYVISWAGSNNVPNVAMISSDTCVWASIEGHLDPAKAKIIYDVTAKRLRYSGKRFVKDDSLGCYVMALSGATASVR